MPGKVDGLGILILANESQEQHIRSTHATQPHVKSILNQDSMMRKTCH